MDVLDEDEVAVIIYDLDDLDAQDAGDDLRAQDNDDLDAQDSDDLAMDVHVLVLALGVHVIDCGNDDNLAAVLRSSSSPHLVI